MTHYTRFLTQGDHYKAAVVKPAAFLPNPRDKETSVSRHGRAPLERLWEIGAVAAGQRPLHGAAIVKAGVVRTATLEIFSDEPPHRHAVIRGWPWDGSDPDILKARRKELAMVLASAAGPPLLK